jgi:hypothetical protein
MTNIHTECTAKTRIEPVVPPQGITAGPPVKIIIGGISTTPVKIGSNLNVPVAAMLLDKDNMAVSGGTAIWTVTASPHPVNGISVAREQTMNGRISASSIQRSHNVTVNVTTAQYPQFTASLTFLVSAY